MKLQKVQSVKMENTNYQESRMPINHELINSSYQSKCFVLGEILHANYSEFERWPHRSLSNVVHKIYIVSLLKCFTTNLFYIAS